MTSLRHSPTSPTTGTADDALLDAARASILAVGWKRSTLTDVARRSGVSRMTIYRRWPDMQTLLADLMTREWSAVVTAQQDVAGTALERVAAGVAAGVGALRRNELFAKIVHVDPELLLPYLLDRRGRSQDALLALLEAAVIDGQRDGLIRGGDPVLLSRSVLLASYGFVFSADTMLDDDRDADPDGDPDDDRDADLDVSAFDAELRRLVEGYLRP
jgi:AcrR family transcriptional regulator